MKSSSAQYARVFESTESAEPDDHMRVDAEYDKFDISATGRCAESWPHIHAMCQEQ